MRLYEEPLQLLSTRKNVLRRNDYNIVYLGDSWVEKSMFPTTATTAIPVMKYLKLL
mgnify:CR=1 FL=1